MRLDTGGGDEQEVLSRDFFESNERSRAIRETCKQLLRRLQDLLYLNAQTQAEEVRQKFSEVEQLEGKLIELDVEADMQMGHTFKEYAADPVLAAEFLAGQIYNLMLQMVEKAVNIPSYKGLMGELGDVATDGDGTTAYTMDMSSMPKPIVDLLAFQWGIRELAEKFGISGQELRQTN